MSKNKGSGNRTVKLLTVITAAVLLQGLTTALDTPNTTQIVTPGQPVNFTVQDAQAEDVALRLRPPRKATQVFQMNKAGDNFRIELRGSNFSEKGLYRYSFSKDSQEFPEDGNFSLTVSSRNETLENKTLNVSDTESQLSGTAYCDYQSDPDDFACEYENFQAGMILSSAIGLQLNSSEYASEKFENFTFGSYGSGFTNCNQAEGEFDCETSTGGSGYYESLVSGTRQGSLINSLWNAYELTGNDSVRQLAMNYTEGSAEDCDVWNNSFNCSTPRAQGLMALGYWSAYEKTGNNTFKSIAENLTGTNYSHPLIPSAYFRAYVFTSNSSYLSEAENRTREWLNDCPNCTSDEMNSLKNTLWTGYRSTGEYGYYRNAVNLTAYSSDQYCSWNSSSCKNPYIQGLSTYNYWKALKSQKDSPESIFNPQIDEETVVGQNLTVNVDFRGKIENPKLMYRRRTTADSSWIACDINFFEGCEIPGDNISEQAPYSYKFQSETVSFPRNGSFSFAPSLVKNTFIDEARSFGTTDPERRCAPSEGDFACEDRALQAPMIKGFTDFISFNFSIKINNYFRNILQKPYITELGRSFGAPKCVSKDGYMSCEGGSGAYSDNLEGSVRQGRIIESLFSAYQSNGEGETYERAMNYTLGAAEDCDVWNRSYEQSFSCGSTQGQSEMIEAYLKAYDVTGNLTFRKKALNLTEEALDMSETSELGSALWEASSYFNGSYRGLDIVGAAENISSDFAGYCIDNCSVEQYLGSSNLFRDAFLFSENDYSSEYRSAVLNTTEGGECGPYKQDVSCSYPSGQGELMELMWGSAYTMPVEIKVEDQFNVSRDTLTVGQELSATCSAQNNLDNTTIQDVEFDLATSEGLEPVSENTSYDAGDLEYSNSSEVTWDIEATSAGDMNTSCSITSNSGYRDTITRDITVEAQETEEEEQDPSTGSPSSPSGGFTGGFVGGDDEEARNQTIVYNQTSGMNWSKTLLEQLGINTTYRNYSQRPQCFTPVRKIRGNNTTLEVQSNCNADGAIVIDRIPSNVSLTEGRSVGDLAVIKRAELVERTEMGLEYRGRNTTNFSTPLVLTSNFSLPPLEMLEIGSQRDGSSALISANLNKEALCTVYNQGEEVYSEETDNLVFQPSLDYGNTTYRVECGDQSFTRTFTKERPETEEPEQERGLPVSWFLGTLLLAALGLGIRYREEIINEAEMKIFEYRFRRFETAVKEGNTAEAIEAFDSMSRDISQEVLESDMDLMQGLMLYLLIDLVEEGKDDEVSFDVSDDLDELVKRYIEGSEGKSIRLVREKYEETMGREI